MLCQDFSKLMQGEFEMSMMGELIYFLRLQIKQCKNGTFLNQAKYTLELLKRFDVSNSKPFTTPMNPSLELDSNPNDKKMDVTLYRGMIGSLIYLTTSRLDIMLSVCLCARYLANPREMHLSIVKCIMRYLVGTPHLGIWHPKSTTCSLLGYLDVNFVGSKTNGKSTLGRCQFLRHSLVTWQCKEQNNVALSTAKAEYIVIRSCCAQLLWMKQQLLDFGLTYHQIPILCDNTSAINLTKKILLCNSRQNTFRFTIILLEIKFKWMTFL